MEAARQRVEGASFCALPTRAQEPRGESTDGGRVKAFFAAISDSQLGKVRLMLEQHPSLANARMPSAPKMTPLSVAVDPNRHHNQGQIEQAIIELLVKKGADPNVPGEDGRYPVELSSSRPSLVFLLRHGANPDLPSRPLFREWWQDAGVVALLASKGADINRRDPSDGLSTLSFIALNARPRGNGVFDMNSLTPEALKKGMLFLIAKGANVNAVDNGSTPLHFAVSRSGGLVKAQVLLDKGARVNTRDAEGNTPLHLACLHASIEAATLLVKRGADVNGRNAEGKVPLMLALSRGSDDTAFVHLLLDARADVNARDKNGTSVMEYTLKNGSSAFVEEMRKRGAKL